MSTKQAILRTYVKGGLFINPQNPVIHSDEYFTEMTSNLKAYATILEDTPEEFFIGDILTRKGFKKDNKIMSPHYISVIYIRWFFF